MSPPVNRVRKQARKLFIRFKRFKRRFAAGRKGKNGK
jgi:hypothetical protein